VGELRDDVVAFPKVDLVGRLPVEGRMWNHRVVLKATRRSTAAGLVDFGMPR
jgi:hypothetical protein